MTGLFSSKNAVKFFSDKYLKGINVDNIAVIGSRQRNIVNHLALAFDFMPNDFYLRRIFKII